MISLQSFDDMARAFANTAAGNYRIACPGCTGKTKTPLSVTVDRDGGKYQCFRCEATGGWRADRQHTHTGATKAVGALPQPRFTLAANWLDFWSSLPAGISGSAGGYLRNRACEFPPIDGDLRSIERLRHRSGYEGPGLVALVTDVVTGVPMTLHKTWICDDGTKADVDPPRMLLGGHRKNGGVIRLSPDDAVTTALAIGEGIETMLTVASAFTPVWSAIDAGNLAAFPVLDGIESLLIVADHDPAGQRAADACARRWHAAGCDVRIMQSPVPGEDINDFARRSA